METKKYHAYTLFNYKDMPQYTRLSAADRATIEIVGRVLPFKTNNYVTDELINWDNLSDDPIFTLNFPRRGMLLPDHYEEVRKLVETKADTATTNEHVQHIRMQLNPNPSGQEHNVPIFKGVRLNGVQHKYRETVLLFPRQGQTCHAYCTFCFRWPQFSGTTAQKFILKKDQNTYLNYLKNNPLVTDILFTGGDPMTMSTTFLKQHLNPFILDGVEQIQTIRIGTKALAYWPYRFLSDSDSDELIRFFEKIVKQGKNLVLMGHFNHPVELSTPAVQQAISRIRSTGAQIRTQSPLLNHINNQPDLWAQMWRKQVNLGCIPYYMFIARDTGAKHYFELPLEECWRIFRESYQQVSGVCRTVRGPSMSANPGKIQILGVSEVRNEKLFVLRFIQGRNPDWVARPFFAKYDPKATWFDDLQPAFGEKSFFFESEMKTRYQESSLDYNSE